jgi:hypothetical protein
MTAHIPMVELFSTGKEGSMVRLPSAGRAGVEAQAFN